MPDQSQLDRLPGDEAEPRSSGVCDGMCATSLSAQRSRSPTQPLELHVQHIQERRYVGHVRRSVLPLLSVWGCGLVILVLAISGGNVRQLFLDPAYANGGPWWTGLVSQLGVLAWSTAAVSAAWAAWIAHHTGRESAARFLLQGALASLALLIDDLVGLHSMFWALGPIGKPFGLALVLSPVGAWLWRSGDEIRRTRWVLLLAAFVANGTSIAADTLTHGSTSNNAALVEDGPKFLGILAWATYFISTTYDIARSALHSAKQAVDLTEQRQY